MKIWDENTDLNINSWLIKWGFMNGYLYDGQIKTTESNIINQWMVIIYMLFATTRHGALLTTPKGPQLSSQLGEWSYFLGPRLLINGICVVCGSYIFLLMAFLKFCTRNVKKMFYWLDIMEYHAENRCFTKMNLNQSDSNTFIKRISILIIILKCFSFSFIPGLFVVNCLSILKHIDNDYQLNHLVAISIFLPQHYYYINYSFGVPIILYLVSKKLIA